MNCVTMRIASALLTCAVLACGTCAAQPVAREDLGRTVKLMILVDKVMQPVEGWTTKEWMIAETRDEGAWEDHVLRLDPKLPPVVSLVPEHVFTAAPAQ